MANVSRSHRLRRLFLDSLESRHTPATFFITQFDDTGEARGEGDSGDLRYCIEQANANPGADTIRLRAEDNQGVYIPLTEALPTITGDLTIIAEGEIYLSISRNIVYSGVPEPEPTGEPGDDGDPGASDGSSGDGDDSGDGSGETPPETPPGLPPGEPEPPVLIDPPPVVETGPKFRIFDIAADTTVRLVRISVDSGNTEDGNGGNIRNAGNLTIENSSISGGIAANNGGNIANTGSLTLINTQINFGSAQGSGGGVYNDGKLKIVGGIVQGNSSGESGGGIRSIGDLSITNTSIVNNVANISGGGIRMQGGALTLSNVTIAFNSADSDADENGNGGGLFIVGPAGDAVLRNTLIAQNWLGSDMANLNDVTGAVSGAYNLIGVNAGLTGLTNGEDGNLVGTTEAPIDPLLVPFPIGYTMTGSPVIGFKADSPARDAGDPDFTGGEFDPRGEGYPRVFGDRVDIGAFESDGTDPEEVLYFTTTDGGIDPVPGLPGTPEEPVLPPPGYDDEFIAYTDDGSRPVAPNFRGFPGESKSDSLVAVGGGVGARPTVIVYNSDGTEKFSFLAYDESFTGGVRVAVGDVNGDGVPDIITAPGKGMAPVVKVFDGTDGKELFSFFAFEETFTGGVFVAAADLNRDGYADIILSPDVLGGPRCKVVDGQSQETVADFLGIEDAAFRGGVRVAARDINGDGVPDLIVGAGVGGGPRVAGFDGKSILGELEKLFSDFFIFEDSLRNGVFVSIGDVDDDAFGDLIFGAGPGGAPRVSVLSGRDFVESEGSEMNMLANFFAGDDSSRAGVFITAKDIDDDGRADLVCGNGEGDDNRITTYLAADLLDLEDAPLEPNPLFDIMPVFDERDDAGSGDDAPSDEDLIAATGVYVG